MGIKRPHRNADHRVVLKEHRQPRVFVLAVVTRFGRVPHGKSLHEYVFTLLTLRNVSTITTTSKAVAKTPPNPFFWRGIRCPTRALRSHLEIVESRLYDDASSRNSTTLRDMKTRTTATIAILALLTIWSNPASAQNGVTFGGQATLIFDGTTLGIGAQLGFPVNVGERQIVANPNVDFYLLESNITIIRANAKVYYPFANVGGSITPNVGAGLGIQKTSVDLPPEITNLPGVDNSDTDLFLILSGGAEYGEYDSRIKPFGELVLALGGGSDIALRGGVRVQITN